MFAIGSVDEDMADDDSGHTTRTGRGEAEAPEPMPMPMPMLMPIGEGSMCEDVVANSRLGRRVGVGN